MGAIRRSREVRPARGGSRVTERDPGTFLAPIGRMQIATIPQLCALTNLSPSTVAARLAKHFAQGLLHTHAPALNGPNFYSLSKRGLAVLVELGFEADELFVLRSLPRPNPHLVAINWLRIALHRACQARSDIELATFLADHDLRRFAAKAHRATPIFVPDSVSLLRRADGTTVGLVTEYDATEETRRQFEAKARTTVELWQRGQDVWGLRPPWRPLLVARTPERLRTLAEPIVRLGGGALWLGGEFARIVADPLGVVFADMDSIALTGRGKSIEYTASLAPVSPGNAEVR